MKLCHTNLTVDFESHNKHTITNECQTDGNFTEIVIEIDLNHYNLEAIDCKTNA